MPLKIVRNDITKMHVDAIVNATDPHRCRAAGAWTGPSTAPPGRSWRRPARRWRLQDRRGQGDGGLRPALQIHSPHRRPGVGAAARLASGALLTACYQNALALARARGCESVAFPLISSAAHGYPKAQALAVAVEAITEFLTENEMEVYIVVFTRDEVEVSGKALPRRGTVHRRRLRGRAL